MEYAVQRRSDEKLTNMRPGDPPILYSDVDKGCPPCRWHLLLQPQVSSDTIDHLGKGERCEGRTSFLVVRYRIGVRELLWVDPDRLCGVEQSLIYRFRDNWAIRVTHWPDKCK